jgi:hypothetical protein
MLDDECTPDDYEQLVHEVVRSLALPSSASTARNRRYKGVKQPGMYEIDIAIELEFDGLLFMLIIVECKAWRRPVDRPQIQKLVQTRDAIGAHKAVMATLCGFSAEAFEVAKVNGVACWVVGRTGLVWGHAMPDGVSHVRMTLRAVCGRLLELVDVWLGIPPPGSVRWLELEREGAVGWPEDGSDPTRALPWIWHAGIEVNDGLLQTLYRPTPVFIDLMVGEIAVEFLRLVAAASEEHSLKRKLQRWREEQFDLLTRAGVPSAAAAVIVKLIVQDVDDAEFRHTIGALTQADYNMMNSANVHARYSELSRQLADARVAG